MRQHRLHLYAEGRHQHLPAVGWRPELSCLRVEPSYVTVILGPKGPATLIKNPGEQGCCSDVTKLGYGNSWSRGPFSYQSSTKGLSCTGSNGHGFFLSKAKATAK